MPAYRCNAGDGNHSEWCKSLARGWPRPDPAIRTRQAFCGAASRQPLRALETHGPGSKAVVAQQFCGVSPSDPQTTKPEHGSPERTVDLVNGILSGPSTVSTVRNSDRRRLSRDSKHSDQRISTPEGDFLLKSLAGPPG